MKHILCLLLIVLLPPAQQAVAQDAPEYAGFDHVEIRVTDVSRSLEFYHRVFGGVAWRDTRDSKSYISLGMGYLALASGAQPAIVQFALGMENFDAGGVQRYLEREGIRWQGHAGTDLWVADGDTIRTSLVDSDAWDSLPREALPPTADAATPIFRPLRLDEVGLSVTNMEVDALFYARVLGRNSVLQAGSLWFGFNGWRLRLNQTPVGHQPGVGYFSVLIANTDLEAAADAVFAAGGIIETVLPNGFSFWDPDGHRVVVHSTPMF